MEGISKTTTFYLSDFLLIVREYKMQGSISISCNLFQIELRCDYLLEILTSFLSGGYRKTPPLFCPLFSSYSGFRDSFQSPLKYGVFWMCSKTLHLRNEIPRIAGLVIKITASCSGDMQRLGSWNHEPAHLETVSIRFDCNNLRLFLFLNTSILDKSNCQLLHASPA